MIGMYDNSKRKSIARKNRVCDSTRKIKGRGYKWICAQKLYSKWGWKDFLGKTLEKLCKSSVLQYFHV